jgi:hypothetical protein
MEDRVTQVIPFPRTAEALPVRDRERAAVMDARQIAARPDLYSDDRVLDACSVLACWGDWIDVQRAVELRRAMDRKHVPLAWIDDPLLDGRLPWWAWCLLGAAALALGAGAAELMARDAAVLTGAL